MVGWYHWLDGHAFEQAPGVGDGQGSLACCSPWGRSHWTELKALILRQSVALCCPLLASDWYYSSSLFSWIQRSPLLSFKNPIPQPGWNTDYSSKIPRLCALVVSPTAMPFLPLCWPATPTSNPRTLTSPPGASLQKFSSHTITLLASVTHPSHHLLLCTLISFELALLPLAVRSNCSLFVSDSWQHPCHTPNSLFTKTGSASVCAVNGSITIATLPRAAVLSPYLSL